MMVIKDARLPRGVYLITPDWTDTARLGAAVAAAIRGGAGAVQYRNKTASAALRIEQAGVLRQLTRSAGLPFFVDNHADLAVAVEADGLHIGRDDGLPAAVRATLPPPMQLGVSCYGDLRLVAQAIEAGAGYVALGAMSASRTKVGAPIVPIDIIGAARRLGVAVVASGGIDADNIAAIAAAGADAVGVVSAIFDAPDPEHATRTLAARFAMGVGKQ
jgi:thiamine-phosphate pyrophosphorylase